MQTENTPTSGEKSSSASASSAPLQLSPNNPFLSPKSPDYMNSNSSLSYSSLYQSNSPTNSPSGDSWDADLRLHEASYVLEYQQLYNRYTLCLTHLHDSIDEVEALRRENESLRVSNADLTHRVALLFSRDRLLSEFNRLSVASSSPTAPAATRAAPVHVTTGPQPLGEHNRSADQRVTLPKSISVRSTGYLKTNRPAREPIRWNTVSQPVPQSQKVSISAAAGAKKENVAALEFDVYNQGMQKTELCNKWQETGACPYNENCQFAHGIKELRPVIRHPRYKTEVCRMVLAGDMCPYGHRCHFRHALTDQERLIVTPSSKLPR